MGVVESALNGRLAMRLADAAEQVVGDDANIARKTMLGRRRGGLRHGRSGEGGSQKGGKDDFFITDS